MQSAGLERGSANPRGAGRQSSVARLAPRGASAEARTWRCQRLNGQILQRRLASLRSFCVAAKGEKPNHARAFPPPTEAGRRLRIDGNQTRAATSLMGKERDDSNPAPVRPIKDTRDSLHQALRCSLASSAQSSAPGINRHATGGRTFKVNQKCKCQRLCESHRLGCAHRITRWRRASAMRDTSRSTAASAPSGGERSRQMLNAEEDTEQLLLPSPPPHRSAT